MGTNAGEKACVLSGIELHAGHLLEKIFVPQLFKARP